MERMIHIAFMSLLLIPVAIFLILQNRVLLRMLAKAGRKRSVKKAAAVFEKKEKATPTEPLSLRERRKKRYEERNKALYR